MTEERLKENNMSYQEEMVIIWKITDDYKSRIEKAVKYINHLSKKNLMFLVIMELIMNVQDGY